MKKTSSANQLLSDKLIAMGENTALKDTLPFQALEASPIGIVIGEAKSNTPIVYVNSAFERITGYTHSEILGRNFCFLQGDATIYMFKQIHLE